MNKRRVLQKILGGSKNIAFGDMIALVEQTMRDYHINIRYSEEDAGYIADIPDLEACSAFGATPDEALREVERAKWAWLDAARSVNKPIPAPRHHPVTCQLST